MIGRTGAALVAGLAFESPSSVWTKRTVSRCSAEAGVKRIYTSEVARTQQTAEPLAMKLNIAPQSIPSKDIDALVTKLRTGPPDGATLVVGHANTLPEIVKRLGGGEIPPIGDGEYDRMFVVTLVGPKKATVITLHYAGCAP